MGETEEISIRDIYSLPWQLWRRACRVPARDTKFKQQRRQYKWIQGGRPKYSEPQTTMKLHAFRSSLVIVCPQKLEGASETLSTLPPPTPPHRALSGTCFPCLLEHVFRPCMVLHKTMQHGFTCFFNSAIELSYVL